MLTTNDKQIDVYNCKPLCPLQFDVGYVCLVWFGLVCCIGSSTQSHMDMSITYYNLYITEFINHSIIFYLEVTAVAGSYKFGVNITCFQLFAYTTGDTMNCQREINISERTTYRTLICETTFSINFTNNYR
jgi:hypothetical protein